MFEDKDHDGKADGPPQPIEHINPTYLVAVAPTMLPMVWLGIDGGYILPLGILAFITLQIWREKIDWAAV